MIALITTVFLASLLGSTHCAGMCGGFLAFAVGDSGAGPSARRLLAAYNLGRLATYLTLGLVAGAIGAAMDLSGAALGVQRTAAIGAGAMMIGFGLVAVLRSLGVRIGRFPVPSFIQKLALAGHRSAAELPPILRAGTVGLLTTLLPCGWLYAFVATAAGTANPVLGAAAMGAFWLGTLPVMVALGATITGLSARIQRHLPLATAALTTVVGLATVAQRVRTIGRTSELQAITLTGNERSIGPADAPVICHGR